MNLWLAIVGALMLLVIATAIEKWLTCWLYRTAILVRADGKATVIANQQA